MIPQPDPPLRSGDLTLRPWTADDAPALVAAWADEEVRRWTAVPARCDLLAAERWIAGWDRRREAGLALDLVVDRGGLVAGEVGLAAFDVTAGTVEIGWWVGAAHRGEGVASTAVALVAGWARSRLGLTPHAEVDPANLASIAIARHAGLAS